MCGGSSGLFGTGLFADKSPAIKMPKVEPAAPPAPERKQDTGAIVAVGNNADDDLARRASAYGSKRKGGSSVGGLTKLNPIL